MSQITVRESFRISVGRAFAVTPILLLAALTACADEAENSDIVGASSLSDLCSAFELVDLPHDAQLTDREMKSGQEHDVDVCVIRGKTVSSPETTINWAVELPAPEAWNGKTLTVGGGGFDGFIPTDAPFTRWYYGKPYARMSSDSGHQVQQFMPWGMDDLALKNHGYLANHKTLEIGIHIATQFYGKAPDRRYMVGISNGARAGLVAAERYPDDYDGVVALAPAINQQSHQLGMMHLMSHVFAERSNWMSPADIDLFMNAEIAACDGLDGLKDGVIHNYVGCDFDATDLLCEGEKTDTCLTPGQIESINLVYSDHPYPFQLADELSARYPRFGRGGAPSGDWVEYIFGQQFDERASFNFFAVDQAVKVVERNDKADALSHNAAAHESEWQRLSRTLDPTARDLTRFAAGGGKLLIWYPAGDACVSMYRLAEYYDAMKQNMGEAEVRAFSRFYVLPALGHVFEGPGANSVDFLDKLESWVEQDEAPDGHVAAKHDEGGSSALFERPVCEFPGYPRYDGEGDPASANSFHCTTD